MHSRNMFIQSENLSRMSEQFSQTTNPETRETLRRLLLEEEDRYGYYSEQLDFACQRLSDAKRRANRQKSLIKEMKSNGDDTQEAEKLLYNIQEVSKLFLSFHNRILQSLMRTRP